MTAVVSPETANRERVDALRAEPFRLLVAGELVGAARTFTVVSPIDDQPIAEVPDADGELVATAVRAAQAAFPAWRDQGVQARAALVRRLADLLEEHAEDLALLDAVDGGAPIAVMAADVRMAAEVCRFFAGLATELKGETVPASSDGLHFSVREPFGVVAKIIPFNHPILFAASRIASPLVAGNCVVLKPAEATPLSALHLGRLVRDLFPAGVLQIVVGDGPEVPRALVRDPAVHRIGFIGSEPTGRAIQRDAAEVGVKDITLELGGKNALIAYPDADPAEVAAAAVLGMNFTWSGQSCGSTSRLLVHESLADEVVAGILSRLAGHRVGSPLDPASTQGTLVSRAQYDKVVGLVEQARAAGATVLTGGGRPEGVGEAGCYYAPTVLDHVDPAAQVAREEVFGPVLSIIRWSEADDPVAIANSVRYGLTASVFTRNLTRAHRVARALEAGYVWINDVGRHYIGMPFGGVKASGLGREESLSELLSYTQVKSVNVAL